MSDERRAVRTTLDTVFDCLTKWLAPILCFTAEEAWMARHGDAMKTSVHAEQFPTIPATWRDEAAAEQWRRIREVRRVVTGAIELERASKRIGSSLQAHIDLYLAEPIEALDGLDLAQISIVSGFAITIGAAPDGAFTLPDVPNVGVVVSVAGGQKCQRCWRVLPEVTGERCRRRSGTLRALRVGRGAADTVIQPARRDLVMLGAGLALLALVLDQWTKHLVLAYFDSGEPPVLHLMPSLNVVLVANHGVSFGLFNASGFSWQAYGFSALALVVAAALAVALWRTHSPWQAAGFGLIIGGAVGNLLDRLRLGSVVDFVDFFIGGWHWYTFNLADAAICTGVGLLLLDGLLPRVESPRDVAK